MRIVHVISSMGVASGGPGVVCAGLAGALVELGHEVTVLTLDETQDRSKNQAQISLPTGVNLVSLPPDGPNRYGKSQQMKEWVKAHINQIDVAHLHGVWQFPTFTVAQACWQKHKPYFVLPHGMLDQSAIAMGNVWAKRLYWYWRESRVVHRSAGLHCLNDAEVQVASPWVCSVPKFVLGNGIGQLELNHLPARGGQGIRSLMAQRGLSNAATRPLVLFMSRLHEKKGLDRFLPFWAKVVKSIPDAVLIVAGTGDHSYIQKLERIISEGQLSDSIFLVGQLAGSQKWQALVDADTFILPSYQEGFSMAITEALGAGCPVVITRECHFDEVASAVAGVVVDGGDMSLFADAIVKILQNKEQRIWMGENGQKLVRSRYTWEKIAQELDMVYRYVRNGGQLRPDAVKVW